MTKKDIAASAIADRRLEETKELIKDLDDVSAEHLLALIESLYMFRTRWHQLHDECFKEADKNKRWSVASNIAARAFNEAAKHAKEDHEFNIKYPEPDVTRN